MPAIRRIHVLARLTFALVALTIITNQTLSCAEEAAVAEGSATAGSEKKEATGSGAKASEAGSAKKMVEPQRIKLADGKLTLPIPGQWKSVKPKNRIIKHEFAIAPAKGEEIPGRVTIMSAGGGVEANIARWQGQFKSSDGKPLADDAKKVEKKMIGDVVVHVVDLTGDFQESMRGPFGPKTNRPGYRMLAAIIPLSEVPGVKGGGTWFVKSYGPASTMKAAEKEFAKMIQGVQVAK